MTNPRTRSGIIDVQTHYVGPRAAQIVAAICARGGDLRGLGSRLEASDPMLGLEARLDAMDRAGVGVSVLSFAPVGVIKDDALGGDLCSAANDDLLEACRRHPDRFVAAAALPFPDTEASLRELQRIAGKPAFRAVHVVAQTTGYTPDRPDIEQVFAAAAALGLPLIIHPAAGVSDLSPHFDAYGLSSGMHAMVSHALVAARIIQCGMMDRIEDLELILTHLGGILPFLIDRLDSRNQGPALHPPSHYLRTRVTVDNCGYPAGPALRCALETFGAERIVVGSDWPSRPIAPVIESIRALGLDDAAEQMILGDNAARWFDPARPRRTQ